MEKIRITSFWLILHTLASFALPAAGQNRTEIPADPENLVNRNALSLLNASHDWLPPLTPEELKNEYLSGVRAQKARQWARATLHYEHVLAWEANHREAQKRLALTLKNVDQLEPKRRLENYYAEGVAAMVRNDRRLAVLAFRKVGALDPEYRDAERLLARATQALRQQLATAHLPAVSKFLLDSLQAQAAKAMAEAQWLPAIVALEKIQVLRPGHPNVVQYLAAAYQHMRTSSSAAAQTPAAFSVDWKVVRLAAILFLLPVLAYLLCSPSTRATLYFMQGNFNKAMRLYEKLIVKNPKQTKYYGKLAQAYLQFGRRDEFALKIYQIVLQLNLLNRAWRQKINGVVAQYYLAEGRNDKDALAVFEEALAYELHQQQNGGMALVKAAPNGVTLKNTF